MKILIISFFFPPYNNIGAVRVGKLAEYWQSKGHDVRVISAVGQPSQSLPMRLPKDRVLYTRWININAFPEMVLGGSRKVARQGYPGGQSTLGRLGRIYKTLLNFPDGQIGWYPFGVKNGMKLIREGWKPDLIYASSKPATSLLIARKLASKFGIPWVAEFRDLWTDNHYYEYPAWRKWIEKTIESRVLSSTSAVVTVSEPLAETLRSKVQAPVATILNGFDPNDYPEIEKKLFTEDRLNIVYTGMVYAGKQDPSPLFAALKGLHCADKVHVYFFGRYLQEISHLAEQHEVGHLVSVSEAVPYGQAIQIQMQSDVLLLLLWNDKSERGVYTGKLFEYFGARHPILAVGAEAGVAGELIRERKAGMISNDPADIAKQLEQWVSIKLEKRAGLLLSPTAGAGLTRDEQFAKLDIFLQEHNLLSNVG